MNLSIKENKKIEKLVLSVCIIVTIFINFPSYQIFAYDFAGNEEYYTNKCKKASLTKSEIEICTAYSEYLKEKNSDVQASLIELNQLLDNSKLSLSESYEKLIEIQNQISNVQLEIDFLQASIGELEISILEKETLIANRMYQTQGNSSNQVYIDFIFGAKNLGDFFSRIESLNEITTYDEELIKSLGNDKALLEEKELEFNNIKDELFGLEMNEQALQLSLLEAVNNYENDADSLLLELSNISGNQNSVNQAIVSAREREEQLAREEADRNNQANSNQSNENTQSNNDNNNSNNNNSNNNNNTGGGTTPTKTGDSIASLAKSKNGAPYVWGGTGPNSFDCSGLTSWAHSQVGISIPRTSSAQFASGTSISINNLQPGDLVFYDTMNMGGASHVGVYLGGGTFIHAGTSSTGVYIANMNQSYWTTRYLGARRYY